MQRSTQEHVILAGNPGTGKSTLLNSLLQKVVFQSGWSTGTGKTILCQRYQHIDGKVYCDTPGLADMNIKEQAAEEIFQLLSNVVNIRLVFVITLEAGRVKPADVASIHTILNACKEAEIENRFGIVFNKMPLSSFQRLQPDDKRKLAACFYHEKFSTDLVFFNPYVEDLVDEDNVFASQRIANELQAFVSSIPLMTLKNVVPLPMEHYAADLERLELELNAIRNASMAQLDEMRQKISCDSSATMPPFSAIGHDQALVLPEEHWRCTNCNHLNLKPQVGPLVQSGQEHERYATESKISM